MDHTYEDWYNCIAQYERTFKEWEGRADKIVKRYRDESRSRNNPKLSSIFCGAMFKPLPQRYLQDCQDPM
jgi:hypothetical protein